MFYGLYLLTEYLIVHKHDFFLENNEMKEHIQDGLLRGREHVVERPQREILPLKDV